MMCFLQTLAVALASAAAVVLALEPTAYTSSGKAIYTAPSRSRMVQHGSNIDLYAPNGTLLHVFENADGSSGSSGGGPLRRQTTSGVGQVFATLGTNDTVSLESFNGTFVVPPPPTTFESQIMFFGFGYTTLDETGAIFIFSGVALQYGGSFVQGGSFYSGAVFAEVPALGEYILLSLPDSTEQLNVGETVSVYAAFQGIENVPGIDGPFYEYFMGFSGPNGDQFPMLEINQQINPQIVGWRVEVEGAEQPSDYPTGPLVFKNVTVELTTGFPSELNWEIEGGSAVDVDFEVVNGDPTNVEIKMTFPDAS